MANKRIYLCLAHKQVDLSGRREPHRFVQGVAQAVRVAS